MVFQVCPMPLVLECHPHSPLCFHLYLVLIKSGIWEHIGQLYCNWHPKGISCVYLHCNKCLKPNTTIHPPKCDCDVAVFNYLCLALSVLPYSLKKPTTIWYKGFLWHELLHWEVRIFFFQNIVKCTSFSHQMNVLFMHAKTYICETI